MNDVFSGASVEALEAEATFVMTAAGAYGTVRPDNVQEASEALAQCTAYLKGAEKLRKALTQPLVDHKRFIDNLIKKRTEPVAETEQALRKAIGAYHTEQERQRQLEERKARQALEAANAAREAERRKLAEAVGVEPEDFEPVLPGPTDVVVPARATTERTSSGTVGVRPVLRFEVEDAHAVPRSMCKPDEARIRDFVKAIREASVDWQTAASVYAERLPGVRVWEEMVPVVRSSGAAPADLDW